MRVFVAVFSGTFVLLGLCFATHSKDILYIVIMMSKLGSVNK